MQNIFNNDFQDFIIAFNKNNVEYILVGGYAVIIHGYNRTTGDMDIWVNPTKENYDKICKAFLKFGMPVFDMTEDKFLNTSDFDVFSFGIPPNAIDLMTKVKGLQFADVYPKSNWVDFEGFKINILNKTDLLVAKKAAGRYKDLDDIEQLSK